ncbi:MAG: threonine synthase [Gammaproteobacteria bacterium]|nr:threonine synthase [Gammaproteobacteria bacterium]
MPASSHYSGIISRYQSRLPVAAGARIVSLAEGNTPLIRLEHLPELAGGGAEIYVKYEGLNPTGSFKDRGMTLAVTQAVTSGSRAIMCASTGNTSASAAAYAARAGIIAFVIIPEGKIAMGKLAQAMMHGGVVIQIAGDFDDGMRMVKEIATTAPVAIVNSINPYRLQGQKTAAFEIVEALGRAPDCHCLPVGNAGNISAHWIGYSEYAGAATSLYSLMGNVSRYAMSPPVTSARPKMLGYQASGAAPFLRGGMVDRPETVATAIRIGHPQSWDLARAASRESGGWFGEFTDAEILATQKLLAEKEGIFCEPASAVSVAGAMRDIRSGRIAAGSVVVCTLTGHGLKDPDTAMAQSTAPVIKVPAEPEAVKRVILSRM